MMNPFSAPFSTSIGSVRRAARRIRRFIGRTTDQSGSNVPGLDVSSADTTLSAAGFDPSGVIVFNDGQADVYNVFEVALQAMIGRNVYWPYENGRVGLQPRYYDIHLLPDPSADASAIAALQWLEEHKEPGPGESLRWSYQFDLDFRGIHIPKPWICGFGQAYAVLAYLCWFRHTSEQKWFQRAVAGARLFGVPCEDGGMQAPVGNGGMFFEEVPVPANTHILNTHLLTLIALRELLDIESDSELESVYRRGLDAFHQTRFAYDVGYWSRYDLPERQRLFVRLSPTAPKPKVYLGKATLVYDERAMATLDMANASAMREGNHYAGGIDWGEVFTAKGFRGRRILYGPALHPTDVPTGTRQNSYILMQAKPDRQDGRFGLELELFADDTATVDLQVQDFSSTDLAFRPTQPEHRMVIRKGLNSIKLPLSQADLGEPLSGEYHRFHVTLLDILADRCQDEAVCSLGKRFRSYEKQARASKCTLPELTRDLPETLYVSVNTQCGLACKMCDLGIGQSQASIFQNLKTTRKTELDPDLLVRRIAETNGGIEKIHFIGTEPLFYKPILDVLKQIGALGYQTVLTTNGLNLASVADDMMASPPDVLWISVDGPPTVHDYIRGFEGLFGRIDDGLRKMQAASTEREHRLPKIFLSCAVSNLNQNSLVSLMESVENWPIEAVTFTHLNYVTEEIARRHSERFSDWPIGKSTINEFVSPDKVDPWVLYCQIQEAKRRWPGKAVFVPDTDFAGVMDLYRHPDRQVGRPVCLVPWVCMEVNANGDVVAMSRCYRRVLGNINEENFKSIWHDSAYKEFRRFLREKGIQPPCYRCCGVL